MKLGKMLLNLFSYHPPFYSTTPNFVPPSSPPLSSLLPFPPLPPLPSLSSLNSLSTAHDRDVWQAAHVYTAFRKVVDIMATGKRYLGTYFRVAFFGKVGHYSPSLLFLSPSFSSLPSYCYTTLKCFSEQQYSPPLLTLPLLPLLSLFLLSPPSPSSPSSPSSSSSHLSLLFLPLSPSSSPAIWRRQQETVYLQGAPCH